jgi:hypothetical protein
LPVVAASPFHPILGVFAMFLLPPLFLFLALLASVSHDARSSPLV